MKIKSKNKLTDLIASLNKTRLSINFNWKKEYYKALKKKYKL